MSDSTLQTREPTGGPVCQPAPRRPGAINIMGLPVHPVDSAAILEFFAGVIETDRQALGLHANVLGCNLAARNPWLKALYNEAQLVHCDGDGIRWGCRILGLPPPPKVAYNVWLWELVAWCEQRGFSLYLLGGRPGVAQRAADNLTARHPGLRIPGVHHGYFDKQGPQSDRVVAEINRLGPDFLLVCFGMPTQELWVRDNKSRLAVHVLLTAGAALDFAAGDVPVAPGWMIRLQIEWLFRFLREPVRMFRRYIIGNLQFIGRALAERLRRGRTME